MDLLQIDTDERNLQRAETLNDHSILRKGGCTTVLFLLNVVLYKRFASTEHCSLKVNRFSKGYKVRKIKGRFPLSLGERVAQSDG